MKAYMQPPTVNIISVLANGNKREKTSMNISPTYRSIADALTLKANYTYLRYCEASERTLATICLPSAANPATAYMHLSNHIHAVKGIYMSLITLQLHPRPANHVNGHSCSIVDIS
jgi:hypothetical protein